MMQPQPADIVAIQGCGWISRAICEATHSQVSHVGMVTGHSYDEVPIVTEALTKVVTHGWPKCIANAEHVWLIRDNALSPEQRESIAHTARSFTGDSYGYADLGLAYLDCAFETRWFTDHLTWGWLNKFPICSYVVAEAYYQASIMFGLTSIPKLSYWISRRLIIGRGKGLNPQSVFPSDIFEFAVKEPSTFTVESKL